MTNTVSISVAGKVIMPKNAAKAPGHPKYRSPSITERIMMFGPGSTCDTVSISRNRGIVSHCFWSTKNCCAIAVEPPKACMAMHVKDQKMSQQLFGCFMEEGS